MAYPTQQPPTPYARKPRRKKWPWIVAGVAVVIVVIVAVSSGNKGTISPASNGQAPAAAAAAAHNATWGQRYTWPDGIAVQVAAPAAFQPSEGAASLSGPVQRAVLFQVTVVNGTHSNYSFNVFTLDAAATFNGSDANEITDIEQSVGTASTSTILPGQSYSYKLGYSVTSAAGTMQLEFHESALGSDTAIFSGKV